MPIKWTRPAYAKTTAGKPKKAAGEKKSPAEAAEGAAKPPEPKGKGNAKGKGKGNGKKEAK